MMRRIVLVVPIAALVTMTGFVTTPSASAGKTTPSAYWKTSSYSANESDGYVDVTLVRSTDKGKVTIPVVATSLTSFPYNDTADNQDYTMGIYTVTFVSGEIEKVLRININAGDTVGEGSETFHVALDISKGKYEAGSPNLTQVTIIDPA